MKIQINGIKRKLFMEAVLASAIIITVIFIGNKVYENYLLSQKKFDIPKIENINYIYFTGNKLFVCTLTDQNRIAEIMESLSCAKATNIEYGETSARLEYEVLISYIDENGEMMLDSFDVIVHKKKYYISPFPYNEVWQIDEELYELLLNTIIDIQSGKIS